MMYEMREQHWDDTRLHFNSNTMLQLAQLSWYKPNMPWNFYINYKMIKIHIILFIIKMQLKGAEGKIKFKMPTLNANWLYTDLLKHLTMIVKCISHIEVNWALIQGTAFTNTLKMKNISFLSFVTITLKFQNWWDF